MKKYRFVDDITSDVVFEAYGRTMKDLFTNAAEALSSVICKLDLVEPVKEVRVEARGDDVEDLLVNWLQVIISYVDVEEMFFSRFRITDMDRNKLVAYIGGEPVTPEKGETVVKAVTYHQFELGKTADGFMCRVSLDI